MTLPKPYYDHAGITIYHADCREILPELPKVDLVLTDPPYPDQHLEYGDCDLSFLNNFDCRQLVFWSAKVEFPLTYTAIHIWDKLTGCASEYERIYERNGQRNYKMFRAYVMNSSVAAQYGHDTFWGHPSQKPRKLIDALINYASKVGDLILDPFLGSGTTAVAAKKLGRKCIGIEREERYVRIAVERCSQEVMFQEVL
jgi:site-specific DNA-methyltransferase (adenine-specific)